MAAYTVPVQLPHVNPSAPVCLQLAEQNDIKTLKLIHPTDAPAFVNYEIVTWTVKCCDFFLTGI